MQFSETLLPVIKTVDECRDFLNLMSIIMIQRWYLANVNNGFCKEMLTPVFQCGYFLQPRFELCRRQLQNSSCFRGGQTFVIYTLVFVYLLYYAMRSSAFCKALFTVSVRLFNARKPISLIPMAYAPETDDRKKESISTAPVSGACVMNVYLLAMK